jgi:alkanesulfonate monooxygenase SsuD/methylene tetrahydromethanopterin reductase-like flavin-dependent oxidoreductase (luciferase family)
MPEEFTAVGVPFSRRGAGFEDYLAALRACWGPDPVEHTGRRYVIPGSEIGPKPLNGRVPVLVGGTTRPAVERAARLGDGFATVFQDWDTTAGEIDWYRGAGGTGTIVLRVNPERIAAAEPASPFTGSMQSVVNDLARAAAAGVNEVIWDAGMAGLEPRSHVGALEALATALDSSR